MSLVLGWVLSTWKPPSLTRLDGRHGLGLQTQEG